MRSLATTVSALALATVLTGCVSSRVPFTHEIRSQYRLSDDEVKNLQFYASDAIKLRRELNATDRQVTGGHRLVLTSGKVIEEVVVEKETPGVVVALSRDTISVSFDVGSQLDFALRTGEVVSPPPLEPDHRAGARSGPWRRSPGARSRSGARRAARQVLLALPAGNLAGAVPGTAVRGTGG
jgi:hypothetical protein